MWRGPGIHYPCGGIEFRARCACSLSGLIGNKTSPARLHPLEIPRERKSYTLGAGKPRIAQAARSVLTKRHATVI